MNNPMFRFEPTDGSDGVLLEAGRTYHVRYDHNWRPVDIIDANGWIVGKVAPPTAAEQAPVPVTIRHVATGQTWEGEETRGPIGQFIQVPGESLAGEYEITYPDGTTKTLVWE